MWRPLYFTPQGSTPAVDPALSPACTRPCSRTTAETMSRTVKPWKWSNGQTVSSKDVLFTFDMIKAAVAASPTDWASYTLGYFPSTITTMSTPNDSTLIVNMKSPVNPTWMEEDVLNVSVMPSAEWARDSANGPILDFTNPANATKIFNFLTAQSKSVSTYATNPLWQAVDGPYRLSSFSDTNGAFTLVPNPSYSGPHATPESDFVGVPFTSNAAEWNAVERPGRSTLVMSRRKTCRRSRS